MKLRPTQPKPSVARSSSQLSAAAFCLALCLAVLNCRPAEKAGKDTMQLTSTAFAAGAAIPAKYTCDATNASPPLTWSGVPAAELPKYAKDMCPQCSAYLSRAIMIDIHWESSRADCAALAGGINQVLGAREP